MKGISSIEQLRGVGRQALTIQQRLSGSSQGSLRMGNGHTQTRRDSKPARDNDCLPS